MDAQNLSCVTNFIRYMQVQELVGSSKKNEGLNLYNILIFRHLAICQLTLVVGSIKCRALE